MKQTSLTHGTIYITISTVVFVISGYTVNIWLGRSLGPAAYGIYGLIISLISTINLTQTSGLPQAVSKFVAEDENKSDMILKSGLTLQIISTVIVSLVLVLFAAPIAHLFRDSTLAPYIQLSAVVFPLYGIYSLYLTYYNGLHFFKTQAIMSIIYAIAKMIGIILLVYFFHIYGAIYGFILSPLIALIYGIYLPKTKSYFQFKKLILFALPLIGIAIFSTLLQSLDLFFIKALLSSNKNVGFYTANQNISIIPFYGVTALASVLFPGISKSVSQNQSDKIKSLIRNSLRFSLLILAPSVLLISATSLQILTFLYSSSYQIGASSLSILVIGYGFFSIFTLLSIIMCGSGSPVKSLILVGAGVVISFLLCSFLIPSFGINGAAFATTTATFTVMVMASYIIYRKFKTLLSIKSMIKILFSSFIIYFLARSISVPNILLPILYLALFSVYFGLLGLLKEITKDDVQLVKSLLPAKISARIKL